MKTMCVAAVAAAFLTIASTALGADGPAIGFDKPVYVDTELAGGEPLVFADYKHGTIIYSSHEGTTHLYRPGFTAPLGDLNFAGNYRNQVNIWTSKDGGKTWQRTVFGQTGFATDPTKNTGFSDPDLTQDEGGRVYDTGIDLANDAIFSSNDGGLTWDKGNVNCHDGDRPWLAGAKKDEAFMAADGNTSGHVIVRSADGGDSCETQEIPDNADGRNGYGKLYYDHNTEQLMEPELYFDNDGNVKAIGLATWNRGDKEFTPHLISNTTLFGHFPSIAIDGADNIYLTWDTNERDPNVKTGCGGDPAPLPNKILMAVSKDHGITWSVRTIAAPASARVLWPWAVAGDAGRVNVVWYQTDKVVDPDCAGDTTPPPKYSLMTAQIFDAAGDSPAVTVADAAGRPISAGGVCQGGTTCVATGQDRRLGDYFTNAVDQRGCVIIASGDTMMKETGSTQPPSWSAGNPALAMAAPPRPPMSAWLDELGRPTYQVMRFQQIAPISALRMRLGSTTDGSISPLPMVLATAVPTTKAASTLNTAAQTTATPGESTRVETTVAIELALSWKPLMKSNTSATATMARTYTTSCGMVTRA